MSDNSLHGTFTFSRFNLAHHVRLDYAAMTALNLVPGPDSFGKNSNLFDLLNKCKTTMGTRRSDSISVSLT